MLDWLFNQKREGATNRPVFQNPATATFEGEVIIYGGNEAAARDVLRDWWRQWHIPKMERARPEPESHDESPPGTSVPNDQSEPGESWRFGIAKSFRKAVVSIDRNLQGRILEAITDIASAPVAVRGDTVKRLGGNMDGFWRYRVGDFRLVYYPDETTRTITLCDFASRGSIYD